MLSKTVTSKIASIAVTLFLSLLCGWWFLGQSLAERPTDKEVREMIRDHENSTGHPQVVQELKEQRRSIDRLEVKMDDIGNDLKDMKSDLKAIRRHQ